MAPVLIAGTSKGIGLEASLAFGRAGHAVHGTMRNPGHSPELARTAAAQKLPITVSSFSGAEWIDLNASGDETWNRRMGLDLGLNTKPAG